MIEAAPEVNGYLSDFAAFEKQASSGPPWLAAMRRTAIDRFAELGFPTTRNEDWRFTNVAPVVRTPYRPAPPGGDRIPREQVAELSCSDLECVQLVFVNGRPAPRFSAV